jgi:predicted PurR-regulated permease PerM
LLLVLSFSIVKPYLHSILLAAIFAGLFRSFYLKLKQKKWNQSLAASTTTLLLICTVLIPGTLLIGVVSQQAVSFTKSIIPYFNDVLDDPEQYMVQLYKDSFYSDLYKSEQEFIDAVKSWVQSAGKLVLSYLEDLGANMLHLLVQTFIFLFSFYYFLIYGIKYLDWIFKNIPISIQEKDRILNNFVEVAGATLKGTIVIALVQGTILGIAMAVLGVPNSLLLCILSIFAAVIPAAGPGLVWVPVAIYLYLGGEVQSAVILSIVGVAFVGLLDNFLRPVLVRKGANMPDLMILIFTLGGIGFYGISGVILGPIIGALLISCWEIFGFTFKKDMEQDKALEAKK